MALSVGKIVGNGDQYRIEGEIAKGAFSVVCRCVDLHSGRSYAIKVVNRKLAEQQHMTEALIREVNAMEVASQSSYVIHLVDKLISKHNYYIVMELAEGGTLLDLIREKRGSGHHSWIAPYFKQLLVGISDMHSNNVVHRDIKPENILLNKQKTRLLISDFGFACYSPTDHELHRACGTLRYCAPELLAESPRYDGRKVDIWAAGVTLYVMFCGAHPFPVRGGADPDTLLDAINSSTIGYPQHVPPDVRDMIGNMLTIDPAKRWSAKALLGHRWMKSVPTRLPGDCDEVAGVNRDGQRQKSNSRPHSRPPSNTATPCPTEGMPPLFGNTPDDANPPPLPTVLSLENIDDGFYFQHSDCSGDEESFDHIGDSNSENGDVFEANVTSGTQSRRDSRFGIHSASSPASSSSPSANTMSLNPSNLGLRNRRHEGEGVDYDVVFEDLFVRPRMYLRGIYLTIATIARFILFCFTLLLATVLRVVFDIDISELPLPQSVLNLLSRLLVPQREHHGRHRPAKRPLRPPMKLPPQRHQQQQQQADEPVESDLREASARDTLPLLHEGLLLQNRGDTSLHGTGDISSPTPGSKLRQYVRDAEVMMSSSTLTYKGTHAHSQANSGSNEEKRKPSRESDGDPFDADAGSGGCGGGGAVVQRPGNAGLSQRRGADPQKRGAALDELTFQLPRPHNSTSSAGKSPLPVTSLGSSPRGELSSTLPPLRTPGSTWAHSRHTTVPSSALKDRSLSSNLAEPATTREGEGSLQDTEGKKSANSLTVASPSSCPPLECEQAGTEEMDENDESNMVSSPSVPLRSWAAVDDRKRLKREDFPTLPGNSISR